MITLLLHGRAIYFYSVQFTCQLFFLFLINLFSCLAIYTCSFHCLVFCLLTLCFSYVAKTEVYIFSSLFLQGGQATRKTRLWASEWTTSYLDRGWVPSQYYWCQIETCTGNSRRTAKASGNWLICTPLIFPHIYLLSGESQWNNHLSFLWFIIPWRCFLIKE